MTKEHFSHFLKEKLPIADIAGIRLIEISDLHAKTEVELTLMSQNPFNSMFWAVQGMAAELSTGVLCMTKIAETHQNISMLVIKQEAEFLKKAVGKIVFTCSQGKEINEEINRAINTGEGCILEVISRGVDESGDIVSVFKFIWSFKVKC